MSSAQSVQGLYTIVNENGQSFVDLFESTPGPDIPIIGYPETGNDNQKWYIADVGSDEYVIISRLTGAYIKANGANIQLVTAIGYPDHPSVRWKISYPKSDNQEIVTFHSVGSAPNIFDLRGQGTAPRTPIQAYPPNQTIAQRWILKKA